MQEPGPTGKTAAEVGSPAREARVVAAIGLILALPATLALYSVKHAGELRISSPDPTPHGYTWSLALFIVPLCVLAAWFARRRDLALQRRAFWRVIPILTAMGCSLDLFLGGTLLEFCNWKATLGLPVPVVGGRVLVEEFIIQSHDDPRGWLSDLSQLPAGLRARPFAGTLPFRLRLHQLAGVLYWSGSR